MVYTHEDRLKNITDRLEIAKNPEIQMSFTVMTMGDQRVCSHCQQHEGIKVMDVYDAIIGVNHPPFHQDCRCIATYEIVKVRTPKEQEQLKLKLNKSKKQSVKKKKSFADRLIGRFKN